MTPTGAHSLAVDTAYLTFRVFSSGAEQRYLRVSSTHFIYAVRCCSEWRFGAWARYMIHVPIIG